MISFTTVFSSVAVAIVMYMTLWFVVSIVRKRNDVADIAWGLGFVVAVIVAQLQNNQPGVISRVSVALTTIWGLRLATHILLRNRGKNEDYRYARWRQEWGKFFYVRSFFQVYLLQAGLLLLVSLPVVIGAGLTTRCDVPAWAAAGIIVWLFGFFFESVGDYQLSKFLANPSNKGKLMTSGLWQYTRHPNYFGEVTQWWGLWLLLTASTVSVELKLLGLLGPLTITTLILFVSGIPLLEKKHAGNKDFQAYSKRTNKFFPWNPHKI